MTWRAILDGPERERAWRAIHAVVDAVRALPFGDDGDELTLFSGQPGIALLVAATARATDDEALADFARERVAAIAEAAIARPNNLYFMTGLTGVVWTIERVAELLGDKPDEADDDDPHDAIDEAALELIERSPASQSVELMKGVAGVGIYALARGARPTAIRCLEKVVDVLSATAEHTASGATWWTPASQLPPDEVALFPGGRHSLGTIHGCLGPIAVLAGACARGVSVATARPLLDAAVRWLWDQRRRAPAGGGWFAVAPELAQIIGTQGWCYGDPGTAAVLFAAGRALAQSEWEAMALELSRDVATRAWAPMVAADPMLCHGATGVGHILNRLFQATGDDTLQTAARAWFSRALDQRIDGRGVGGFVTSEGKIKIERSQAGLVDGSSGAALALLAATTDQEPMWDRALILS